MKDRLHDPEEFFLLIQLGRGELRPHPVEKLGDIFLRDDGAFVDKGLYDAVAQACLHGVETLVPAYPQGHLPVECRTLVGLGMEICPFILLFVQYGKGFFSFALEEDVKAQAFVIHGGAQLERHGGAFNMAGYVRILPEKVFLLAYRPEKPGKEAVGDFHAVPIIVEILCDLPADDGEVGGMFAPFGIVEDLLEGDLLPHG